MLINHAHYDSAQAQIMRRFARTMVRAAYTFSKSTGLCCNDSSDTAPAIQMVQHLNLARAVEPQERTHVFTLSWSLRSPFGKGQRWMSGSGMGAGILDGFNGSITSSAFGTIANTITNRNEGVDSRTLRFGAKLVF